MLGAVFARFVEKTNGIFALPLPPPISAAGHRSLVALAAPPARRGSTQQWRTARHSAAARGLDMPLRMGYADASGAPSGEGLGTTGFGKLGGIIKHRVLPSVPR
jgi:hypothetical protein